MASTPDMGATTEIRSIETLMLSSIGVRGGVSIWLREDDTESRNEYVVGSDQSWEDTEGPEEERSPRTGVGVISPLPNALKTLSSVYMGCRFPSFLRSFSFPLELLLRPEVPRMRSLTEDSDVFLDMVFGGAVGTS